MIKRRRLAIVQFWRDSNIRRLGFGVNSKSKRIEEAYKFIKWACMDNISAYSVLGGSPSKNIPKR